ncbi:hybrid sensor histidine kinase/response regulator [Azospirillum agricola]|uniref:hybrid sensor histidine kinase/response regulator n=1 Tax=Azospirillum agricola TaxID=1720247 RepID=UPI000A0F278B|nr:PAS domain S-box protein [Azospirillum agricola]SMH59443.1 PAS domain S-box-containing protein [Azospirillum lipoferum]
MDVADAAEPIRNTVSDPASPASGHRAALPEVLAALTGAGTALALLVQGGAVNAPAVGALSVMTGFALWSARRVLASSAALRRSAADRRTVAAALAASRRRARDFAESSSDWFWETGPDHRYVYVSDRLARILGRDPRTVFGETLLDLARLVEDAATWAEYEADIAAGRAFRELEINIDDPSGRSFFLRISAVPVLGPDGRFIGYRGCGVDVTAETLALVDARFMQTVVHDAVDSVSEGFVLFSADGRLLICNERYRQAYPNIADLLVPGVTFAEILRAAAERGGCEDGDVGDWVEQRLKRHLDHSAPVDGLLSDGRWYRISEHATGTGGVVKILMDITELKTREEELAGQTSRLERTVSALQESERRYRQLVELAPYGIVIWDRAAIRFANGAAAEILGVEAGGLEGRPLAGFLEDGHALEARLAVAAEGRGQHLECEAIRPSGERRFLEVGASPAVYRREPAALLVLNDVTDRRRVEGELQRAQKMEAVGRMAGGIAHEFNNMLTAIGGFARLAERNPGDAARVLTCVQEIAKASERAAALTGQLLDFSHRRVSDEREVVGVAQLLRDLRVFLKPLISAGIDVSIEIGDEGAHTLVNPVTLNQALLNLALNARDAMPDGGALTIALTVETPDAAFFTRHGGLSVGRYIVIRVADQGCGVPEAIRDRVWEPFFTTKEPGKGTGLGLWMVYGTAQQAGGVVEMESEEGQGTVFSLYLPATAPPVPVPGLESLRMAEGESAAILLVDDEESVRTYLRLALEEAGCVVTEAADGIEALERYDEAGGLFDAVVSDVSMPRMNGPDLGRALEERNPDLRILFLTGYASKETAAGLTAQTGRTIVMKPVTPERLLQALRDLLAN